MEIKHSRAHMVIGLLIFSIALVLLGKFWTNQDYFFQDLVALRNYVALTIIAMGFLIGLFYLTSQSTQQHHSTMKSVKSKSAKSKKKRK